MQRSPRPVRSNAARLMEMLEHRQLYTTVTPVTLTSNDPVSDSAFMANGNTSDYNGAVSYVPTDPLSAGSVLSTTRLPVGKFDANVLLVGYPERIASDFKDFVIEGAADTALSSATAGDAGYAGGTFSTKSVAVVIDGSGSNASNLRVGFAVSGEAPTSFVSTGIDDSGSSSANGYIPMRVRYSDGKLRVTLTDGTHIFSTYKRIDIPSIIGGQSAYVGLSGSTGDFANGANVVNNGFQNFNYTGYNALDFTAPAAATIASGGTTATLDGAATYASDADISYEWTTTQKPRGAATPIIDDETDASTTVDLKKAGTYHFRLTATDTDGSTTFSNVSLRVAADGSRIAVLPHASLIQTGSQLQFSARLVDQFGKRMASQPTFAFAVESGGGSIDAASGLYTAPDTIGHLVIEAAGGDLSGVAGATIVKS